MDISSATQALNSDYIKKITDAMSVSANATKPSGATFDSVYKAVAGTLNNTNDYIQSAQKAEVDFALGNITSTHELGVIQQKANIALQYTVAIRDKVLDAYKEIMNMNM